jgi:transcriptional regulator with XRE-family HTH domain
MRVSHVEETRHQDATLAAELKKSRQEKGWSQLDLATESKVSTRTIVGLETAKAKMPRADVIVRLAHALGRDAKRWLALTGHSNLGEDQLERTVRAAGGFRFRGEMDPGEFFSKMLDDLSDAKPCVMCVCYPSAPGTNHRPDVRNILVKALQRGLTLALICPFPNTKDSIENSEKPSLTRYYREVYEHIILFARDLTKRLAPNRQDRVAVFVPQDRPAGTYWEMPPMGVSKVRQALIQRFTGAEDEDADLQLVAWVELVQDQKDRMVEIYPTETRDRDRLEVLRCWKDYLAEIMGTCDVRRGKAWTQLARTKLKDWTIIDLKQGGSPRP